MLRFLIVALPGLFSYRFSLICDYFENREPPIICHKYNKSIRNTISNFSKLVSDLEEEQSAVFGHSNHLALKFSVNLKERQGKLPQFTWSPKLHIKKTKTTPTPTTNKKKKKKKKKKKNNNKKKQTCKTRLIPSCCTTMNFLYY